MALPWPEWTDPAPPVNPPSGGDNTAYIPDWLKKKKVGPGVPYNSAEMDSSGYFTFHTAMPPVAELPSWSPQWDENFVNFLSFLGEKAKELINRPKGLTPQEEALLRARMAEASKGELSSAMKSAEQSLYNMGLYGSPAVAKAQAQIASKYTAQELARLRDLEIQEKQTAWQRALQAQQIGQQYASLMENWENIKNKYGLAAAEFLRQNILTKWKMAAERAAAARADALMTEKINAARRNEMLRWLLALRGLYGTDYGNAMRGWGQQWANYWGGQQASMQDDKSFWGGLGNALSLYFMGKYFQNRG